MKFEEEKVIESNEILEEMKAENLEISETLFNEIVVGAINEPE